MSENNTQLLSKAAAQGAYAENNTTLTWRRKEMSVSEKTGTITVAALIAGLLPITVEAGTVRESGPTPQSIRSNTTGQPSVINTKARSCSDFLSAQGTNSKFFPPVPDYVGWTDAVDSTTGLRTTFGLVDYAGLAAEYLKEKGVDLKTIVTCLITEEALTNGRAKISVALSTTNALGFAQSYRALINSNGDFLNTPTIFGAKAQDIDDPAQAALGSALLNVSFHISPGGPLPDLVDVVVDHPCIYKPVTVQFQSLTSAPKGTDLSMSIRQVGSSEKTPPSCLNFKTEEITIGPRKAN